MNPYKRAQTAMGATGVAIGTFLAKFAQEKALALSLGFSYASIASIVVIAATIRLTLHFGARLLGSSKVLRWLVFGKKYDLQGRWVDVMWKNGHVYTIGVTYIEIRDFSVYWAGKNCTVECINGSYRLNDSTFPNFRTKTSLVNWPDIEFWTHDDPHPGDSRGVDGLAKVTFETEGDNSHTYSGWGSPVSEPTHYEFSGKRVTAKADLVELANPTTRFQAAVRILGLPLAEESGNPHASSPKLPESAESIPEAS